MPRGSLLCVETIEQPLAQGRQRRVTPEPPLSLCPSYRVVQQAPVEGIEIWKHRPGKQQTVELLKETVRPVERLEYREKVAVLLVGQHEVERDHA